MTQYFLQAFTPGSSGDLFGLSIFLLLLSALLFFLFREITLWYFKINENTKNISRIADALETIAVANDFLAQSMDEDEEEEEEEEEWEEDDYDEGENLADAFLTEEKVEKKEEVIV